MSSHPPVSSRNFGIDLLRIVAMLMVCLVHVNLWTKVHLVPVAGKAGLYYFGMWTESLCFIGVNLYAIITGYVCVRATWNPARYLLLWAQVAFYTLGLVLLFMVLSRSGMYPDDVTIRSLFGFGKLLFVGSGYWYFAAYTGVFLLLPYLNPLLLSLNRLKFTCLMVVLIGYLAVANCFLGSCFYDKGYNMTWLLVLYCVGAYLRLHPVHIPTAASILVVLLFPLQPVIAVAVGLPHGLNYCSPVFIVYSICLFRLFVMLEINNRLAQRLIGWAAPLSFGVYLIHSHPYVWKTLETFCAQSYQRLGQPWWYTLAIGPAIYLGCTFADALRLKIFVRCRVKQCAELAGEAVSRWCGARMNKR